MRIWDIIYYPPSGERDSPFDYIVDLADTTGKAQIAHRLDFMSTSPIGNWPQTWIHKISDKIHQLTAGQSRIMYCLDEGTIVVLHACKKVGRRARRTDIRRAETHFNEYFALKEG